MAMYNDKNQLDGFDVEVSKKIAEMLGVKIEFVPVGATDRVPFVTSGKIDFVMGSMTRTTARAKIIDFTVPVNTEALGVLTTAKKPFKSWRAQLVWISSKNLSQRQNFFCLIIIPIVFGPSHKDGQMQLSMFLISLGSI
jgi:ABC-type amino acid transport substrate-binding protein